MSTSRLEQFASATALATSLAMFPLESTAADKACDRNSLKVESILTNEWHSLDTTYRLPLALCARYGLEIQTVLDAPKPTNFWMVPNKIAGANEDVFAKPSARLGGYYTDWVTTYSTGLGRGGLGVSFSKVSPNSALYLSWSVNPLKWSFILSVWARY